MCWVLGDLALSTGVKMSDIERFGGCVWKLFQLGTVVVLLGLGFLFFIREDEETVEKAQVGWIFSGKRHARLRQLQRTGRKPVGAE